MRKIEKYQLFFKFLFITSNLCAQGIYVPAPTHGIGNYEYGEMDYQFIDSESGLNRYRVTLKIANDCTNIIPYSPNHYFFLNESQTTFSTEPAILDSTSGQFHYNDPCIITDTVPCFNETTYHADFLLKPTSGQYIISTLLCCVTATNIFFLPYGVFYNGFIFAVTIPGTDLLPPGETDNSPVFNHDSLYYLHNNRPFVIAYGATDPDGDSLVYRFNGGEAYYFLDSISGVPKYFASPPYYPYPYNAPASGSQPLGPDVSIDSSTGIISGTPHEAGQFFVNVSALEYRHGILIGQNNKEFMVHVYDSAQLIPVVASIPPYDQCDSFTVQFTDSSSPRLSYAWELGDGTTSTLYSPVHTYADTGNYPIRLIVNPGHYCADTAYSSALIYPDLVNSFIYADTCINQQVQFTGSASTVYGSLDYYHWNFSDPLNKSDTLDMLDAVYQYTEGDTNYLVSFTAGTDKGCLNTKSTLVTLYQNPLVYLVRDTLISIGQPFQLQPLAYNTFLSLASQYSYQWSPTEGLDDPFIKDPTVTLDLDNSYILSTQNLEGCITKDTIDVKFVRGPNIYVPNAFTPNGDGKNDIFRPLPVGIRQIEFFRVYDRWGKLVYQTTAFLQGWDGNIHGSPAQAGPYIWEVQGIDLTGKTIFKKGSVILIR